MRAYVIEKKRRDTQSAVLRTPEMCENFFFLRGGEVILCHFRLFFFFA